MLYDLDLEENEEIEVDENGYINKRFTFKSQEVKTEKFLISCSKQICQCAL